MSVGHKGKSEAYGEFTKPVGPVSEARRVSSSIIVLILSSHLMSHCINVCIK